MSIAIGRHLRIATFALGFAVVFLLLMLASLWFAIPFGLAFAVAVFAWFTVALRFVRAFRHFQSWKERVR
jgi:phosphatidylglycerophosphate synthase